MSDAGEFDRTQAAQDVSHSRIDLPSGTSQQESGTVIVERPVTVMVEQIGSFTLLCTPTDLKALGVGFVFSEGIIESADEVLAIATSDAEPYTVTMQVEDPSRVAVERNLIIASSCGLCGVRNVEKVLAEMRPCGRSLRILPTVLGDVVARLEETQEIHKTTRGAHAVGVFTAEGELVAAAEDIGRHNALDKAIGKCLLAGVATAGCGVVLSSRVSFDLVVKAARAGIELIAAISAPSDMAIEAAERWSITLCARVRPPSAGIYCHPERVGPQGSTGDCTT